MAVCVENGLWRWYVLLTLFLWWAESRFQLRRVQKLFLDIVR